MKHAMFKETTRTAGPGPGPPVAAAGCRTPRGPGAGAEVRPEEPAAGGREREAAGRSDKNRRYRNKGSRKTRANLSRFGNNNGFTLFSITNTFGKFRAHPANLAQIC